VITSTITGYKFAYASSGIPKTTPIGQKCLNAESYAKKKGLFFPMPIAKVRV